MRLMWANEKDISTFVYWLRMLWVKDSLSFLGFWHLFLLKVEFVDICIMARVWMC